MFSIENKEHSLLRRFIQRLSVIPPIIVCMDYIDRVFLVSELFELIIDKWSEINAFLWRTVISQLIGLPDISNIDIVFLSFFLFLTISYMTCITFDRAQHQIEGRIASILALLGMGLIVLIFTLGDIATLMIDNDDVIYEGIQKNFFDIYVRYIDISSLIIRSNSMPLCAVQIISVYLFYAIMFILHMLAFRSVIKIASMLPFLEGMRVSRVALASRVLQILLVLLILFTVSTVTVYIQGKDFSTFVVGLCI